MVSFSTLVYTSIALMSFAGNSVLCRLALATGSVDPASFTVIRLLAGSVTLFLIFWFKRSSQSETASNRSSQLTAKWLAPAMLFVYAICFSFAYVTLETGTGALILFGSVQLTMIVAGLFSGNKLNKAEGFGLAIAFTGFVYLMAPQIGTPSLVGFVLMTLSGMAWGVYTLLGRGSKNPIRETAANFHRTLPFVLSLLIFTFPDLNLSEKGLALAILSGSLASGIGYFIWYMALPKLTITTAAVVQLLVPIIAATGGVVFAAEEVGLRLILASILVLGGVFLVVTAKQQMLGSGGRNV